MPSLNVAPYIGECLESIVNQSLAEIEIICIDAASTDGTREIIANYVNKDERITCIDSDIKSYGHQVNIGIKAAKGEYIAILETDDYVDFAMYEKLYDLASKYELDYIKADFDSFIERKYGRLFFSQRRFCDRDKYHRIVNGQELPEIFVADFSLWSGIYKRDFLNRFDIELNESQGAAYQDIGFVLLVMTYAKRAMYIDNSFYRYRMRREGCSSCSDKILQFSYQEFARLIDELHLDDTDTFKYIVCRMAEVFLGEYTKLLSKCSFVFDKSYYETYVEKYYTWFKNRLLEYISRDYIMKADLSEAHWKELNLLLNHPMEFSTKKEAEFEKRVENINCIIEKINARNVVIVSCGVWGKKALDILLNRNVDIISICDNDPNVWGTSIAGIIVQSLPECASMYENAVFVIANKRYEDALKQQLISLNVCTNNIMVLRM